MFDSFVWLRGKKVEVLSLLNVEKGLINSLLFHGGHRSVLNRGIHMTILVFLKGPSESRQRRDVDPGKVQEQDDVL